MRIISSSVRTFVQLLLISGCACTIEWPAHRTASWVALTSLKSSSSLVAANRCESRKSRKSCNWERIESAGRSDISMVRRWLSVNDPTSFWASFFPAFCFPNFCVISKSPFVKRFSRWILNGFKWFVSSSVSFFFMIRWLPAVKPFLYRVFQTLIQT